MAAPESIPAASEVADPMPLSQVSVLAELGGPSGVEGAPQAAPQSGSQGLDGEKAKSDSYWDGASETKPLTAEGSASTPAPESRKAPLKLAGFTAAAALAAPSVAAAQTPLSAAAAGGAHVPAWLAGIWLQAKDFVFGGGILLATYAANRLVRWGVEKLGKHQKWHPDTTDKVRFVSSLATWSAGVTTGLAHFGVSGPILASTIGVGVTLAVTETVSNFVHAAMLLFHKPFRVGETVRVGDTLYIVDDLTLKHVELRVVGKLMESRPQGSGSEIVPLSELDGFHREADDKGRRYVQRINAPDGTSYIDRFEYTQLADKPITVFRPYVKKSWLPKLSWPGNPLSTLAGAFRETPKSSLKSAIFWTAVAAGLFYGLPLLKAYLAWSWLQASFPFLQGITSLLVTGSLAGWLGRFSTYVAQKLGWSRHATAVLKLSLQIAVYTIGGTLSLRVLGLEWKTLTAAFGATAAAFTFTQRDILTNIWKAIRLRFDRLHRVGDTLTIGEHTGRLVEINTNYLILETAPESYALLPLSYVKLYPIRSIMSAMKPDASRDVARH